MKALFRLTLVAVGLIIFGGYVGYSVRDSRAKAFAAKAAEDRRVAQAEFEASLAVLEDSLSRVKSKVVYLVSTAEAADSALDALPLPDPSNAVAVAAIASRDAWRSAFGEQAVALSLAEEERDNALERIKVLQGLRDEGAAVVASPGRKLFGFLPRPELYVGADVNTALAPQGYAGVAVELRSHTTVYAEMRVGPTAEQRFGVRVTF